MKVTIEAEPKEMADLVKQLQDRQKKSKKQKFRFERVEHQEGHSPIITPT